MNHWKPLGLVTLVVNFVKIATMFVNLDFLEKNLLSIILAQVPAHARKFAYSFGFKVESISVF